MPAGCPFHSHVSRLKLREAQEAKSKGRLMNAATGWDLDLAEQERMLDEYYALRGWS